MYFRVVWHKMLVSSSLSPTGWLSSLEPQDLLKKVGFPGKHFAIIPSRAQTARRFKASILSLDLLTT